MNGTTIMICNGNETDPQARKGSGLPVFILSAMMDEADRGFGAGVDEYITGSCSPEEAVTRVRAVPA